MIDVERSTSENVGKLKICGVLDALSAPSLGDDVQALASSTSQLVLVDLTKLELIDSSGVAVLVALFKRLNARKAKMAIIGANAQPLAILKLLKLDEVFDLREAL